MNESIKNGLSWFDEKTGIITFYAVVFVAAFLSGLCLILNSRLNDIQYLSVRITALQATQQKEICKAMIVGKRADKGWNKDCTDFIGNE